MKKAFTLIELLVVIAIIAILAAILFPVFAQAKEAAKKASDISNQKQTATALLMYCTDSDDLLPLQAGRAPSGQWGFNFYKYVPANWAETPVPAERVPFSEGFALNTVQPYMKNYEMLYSPGAPAWTYQPTTVVAAGRRREKNSYAFNGLLTAYSTTAVASPADLPLITGANGYTYADGGGFANPALTCADPLGPCNYIPRGATACGTGNGSTSAMYTTFNASSYWHYSRGQNWAFTDGHVKFRPVGRGVDSDWRRDPWTGYDVNTGKAGSYWWNGCHPWLFRPDFDFVQ
jgi:prepilin-type N-terminal cleavage/methylation domain-containing protein